MLMILLQQSKLERAFFCSMSGQIAFMFFINFMSNIIKLMGKFILIKYLYSCFENYALLKNVFGKSCQLIF